MSEEKGREVSEHRDNPLADTVSLTSSSKDAFLNGVFRILCFDLVFGTLDRNERAVMAESDGNTHPIDHEYIFVYADQIYPAGKNALIFYLNMREFIGEFDLLTEVSRMRPFVAELSAKRTQIHGILEERLRAGADIDLTTDRFPPSDLHQKFESRLALGADGLLDLLRFQIVTIKPLLFPWLD
ncbi:hypothetical protein HZC07_05705 [Candidatus Micrarchaeota archaeon]|nr:hypothetical protein [Candidatus Micrarchaeota archaeon]